jgi:predicted nucleic acid-binding Zn ribbon protein
MRRVAPREPSSLKSLLPALLGRLAREGGPASMLQPLWAELVGPVLAAQSRPSALHGKVLVVTASSPLWAGALEAQGRAVVARLSERHPGLGVERLEVRVG